MIALQGSWHSNISFTPGGSKVEPFGSLSGTQVSTVRLCPTKVRDHHLHSLGSDSIGRQDEQCTRARKQNVGCSSDVSSTDLIQTVKG